MKKKVKLTGRQIKLIINFISLAIFAFSYFYVYSEYVKKTEAAHQSADTLQLAKIEHEKKLAEEETVQKETAEVKEQIEKFLTSYPVYIAKEDNFIFIEKLQKDLNLQFISMNVGDSVAVVDTELPARSEARVDENEKPATEKEALEESETMKGMATNINLSFITTMNGFKEFVDYINAYPKKTAIESAAVGYDSSTGNLSCNVVLKRYYLTGTGKTYEPPYINDISIGTDNIFGTTPETNQTTTEGQNTEGQNTEGEGLSTELTTP